MPSPSEVRDLKKSGATLEEIGAAFGVERRDDEVLRSWCRRIEMAIYREELEYKSLRDIDVAVHFEYRRDEDRARVTREQAQRDEMIS